jgi:hypothetical protein
MTGSRDELFLTFVVGSHGREDIACVLLKKLLVSAPSLRRAAYP